MIQSTHTKSHAKAGSPCLPARTVSPADPFFELALPAVIQEKLVTAAKQARAPSQPDGILKVWGDLVFGRGLPAVAIALAANYLVSLPAAAWIGQLCKSYSVNPVPATLITWAIPTTLWHGTFLASIFSYDHARAIKNGPEIGRWSYIKEKINPYLKMSAILETTWLAGIAGIQIGLRSAGHDIATAAPVANAIWSLPFNLIVLPIYFTVVDRKLPETISKLWAAAKWTVKKWGAGLAGAILFRERTYPSEEEENEEAKGSEKSFPLIL